jgi:crossover junction endodeoxyribonuclease RuvC
VIILGIDPGTLITGYGVVRLLKGRCKALDYGCIKPPANQKISDRYLIIYDSVDALLERYQPEVLVVETQYVKANVQSAIKLGMARGVVLIAAKRRGIQVFEYSPTQPKKAVTGNGRASKLQVQHMVQHILELEFLPEPEDAADALALAICHAQACHFKKLCGVEI